MLSLVKQRPSWVHPFRPSAVEQMRLTAKCERATPRAAADAPPRRDAWRRSTYWSRDPDHRRARRPGSASPDRAPCRWRSSRRSAARSGCTSAAVAASGHGLGQCGVRDSIARSSSSPSMRRASRPTRHRPPAPRFSVYLLGEAPASLGSYSVLITPGLPPKGLPTLKTTRPRPL